MKIASSDSKNDPGQRREISDAGARPRGQWGQNESGIIRAGWINLHCAPRDRVTLPRGIGHNRCTIVARPSSYTCCRVKLRSFQCFCARFSRWKSRAGLGWNRGFVICSIFLGECNWLSGKVISCAEWTSGFPLAFLRVCLLGSVLQVRVE